MVEEAPDPYQIILLEPASSIQIKYVRFVSLYFQIKKNQYHEIHKSLKTKYK